MGIFTRRAERAQQQTRNASIRHQACIGLMLHKGISEEDDSIVLPIIRDHLDGDPSGMGGLLARALGAATNCLGLHPDSTDTAERMMVMVTGVSLGDVNPQAGIGFKLFVAGARKDHVEYERVVQDELDGDESNLSILMYHALTGVLAIVASRTDRSIDDARYFVMGQITD